MPAPHDPWPRNHVSSGLGVGGCLARSGRRPLGVGAVVDVLLGEAQARGRLPFDLPSFTKAVTDSRSDVPYDTADPLYRFGDGIVD
jgi:hypothetical protein